MIDKFVPDKKNQTKYDQKEDDNEYKFGNDLNSLKVDCNAKGDIRWSLKLKNKDPEKQALLQELVKVISEYGISASGKNT